MGESFTAKRHAVDQGDDLRTGIDLAESGVGNVSEADPDTRGIRQLITELHRGAKFQGASQCHPAILVIKAAPEAGGKDHGAGKKKILEYSTGKVDLLLSPGQGQIGPDAVSPKRGAVIDQPIYLGVIVHDVEHTCSDSEKGSPLTVRGCGKEQKDEDEQAASPNATRMDVSYHCAAPSCLCRKSRETIPGVDRVFSKSPRVFTSRALAGSLM